MIVLCLFLLRLVLVQPPQETIDSAAMLDAQQAVMDAASFWQTRAPFALDLSIAASETMTTTADVYTGDIAWASALSDEQHITVVVVDNRVSHRYLLNGRAGGYTAGKVTVVTLLQTFGAHALEAMLAHEFGHALFGLPDLYTTPGACDLPDIMCSWIVAYNTPTIGCASLARLGYSCRKFYLANV